MRAHLILYALLATFSTARNLKKEALSFPGPYPGPVCMDDGIECDPESTCFNCCAGSSYYNETNKTTVCGYGPCLEDGTVCSNETDYSCWNCCNGAYEDGGKTCGGQCLTSGKKCDIETTCNLCCNSTYVKIGESYECGCLEDGKACIPGENCHSCCNGAYDDNGMTCGGTCIEDGKVCEPGEDCHLCCTYSTYWYSTGKMQCGSEPCYADGKSCIPGVSCYNCCSGAAYDGNGAICGGKCLKAGAKCSYLGSCNKCCQNYPETSPQPLKKETIDVEVHSVAEISYPYPISGPSYWSAAKKSMVCGYELCLPDGKACVPGYNCHTCCNGAYDNNGKTCGGTCRENGTMCNFYSTCSLCCQSYKYDAPKGAYFCSEYESFPRPLDDSTSSTTKDYEPVD